MAGFVATAPSSNDPDDDGTVINDGWFPDLSLSVLRNTLRLDGTVTEPRLREATRYAIAFVNGELAQFKAGQLAAGVGALADVSAASVDGEPRLVMLYRRAVGSTVKADLIERYRDFDSTDSGQRRAEDMDPAVGEQRRNAFWAVREILGQPRSVVELI